MEAQKQQLKKVNNLLEELGENSVERDYMDNALTFNITLLQNEKEEIEREIQYFEIDKQQWYEQQMDIIEAALESRDKKELELNERKRLRKKNWLSFLPFFSIFSK